MNLFTKSIFTLLLAFVFISAQAQNTGKIIGKIIDKKTGEELIGVSVQIEGTTTGTVTDFEGKYQISGLLPGKYVIVISYLSYSKKIITGIEVRAKESTTVNVSLEESTKELNEVVIRGEVKKETSSALLIQQKKSVSISDGVSADLIKRTPDATTSDVMKRVSGTSIQDNKFAVIRGLNDRYNSAYINGAPLPSTESDRKAFSFDIFPANMIDNMVITKTASADLPGDFAGGLITINTKDIPEKRFLSIGFSGGIHSITTGEQGSMSNSGKNDWIGLDDGTRTIPSNIPARGQYHLQTPSEKAASSMAFNDDWSIRRNPSLPMNYSIQLSGGNNHKFGAKNEFGYIISTSYSNSYRNTVVERNRFIKPLTGFDNQFTTNYTDSVTKHEILAGAMANFAIKLGGNHKISFKNAYTINTEDVTQLRSGVDDFLDEQVPLVKNTYFSYQQNQLLTSQLIGEHFLTAIKTKLKWVANYNQIKRDIPDFRRFSTRATIIDPETKEYSPYSAQLSNGIDITQTGRFFSTLDENIKSIGMDLQRPIEFITGKKVKTDIKIGGLMQQRARDFQARAFGYRLRQVFNPNSKYNYQNFIRWGLDSIFNKGNINDSLYLDEDFRAQDVYSAQSNLNAAYIMLDQRLFSRFRISYGLRVESYRQLINTFELNSSPPKPITIDTTFIDVLPSANFTYELTEKINLRASASRTVARPEFRELAPFAFYDFNINTVVTGKPNLTRTSINNYDFRFEYYPGEAQLISVSLFYKDFRNAIETVSEFLGSDPYLSYTSDANAQNYGFEIELRKNFDFIDKWTGANGVFRNFSFTLNYAQIISEVVMDASTTAAGLNKRPLQGQSPYILNTSLQYYNPKNALSAAIFVNQVGRRIAFVREKNGRVPDVWENPRMIVDLSVSKRLYKGIEAKITLGDILAQDLVFYQDNNNNGKFDDINNALRLDPTIPVEQKSTFDNTMFRYKMGYTVSVGLSYKF